MKEVIIPAGGARPLAPYSPAIRLDGHLVFTAGQVGLLPGTRDLAAGGVAAQARQALENLKVILEAAGGGLDTVVKTTVFLADMGDYAAVNDVYAEYFTADPPARSAVAVAALPINALVEIEAIAFVKAG
jgi:2-iminobutanoate/2-iminopropanoate deaminase